MATSFLFFWDNENDSVSLYASYLGAAAALWLAATIFNARIEEEKSEIEESSSLIAGLKDQLELVRKEARFRDFLIVRTLAVGSGLSKHLT